jgi:lipoprotein Spr
MRQTLLTIFIKTIPVFLIAIFVWGCKSTSVSLRYGKKDAGYKGKTIYDDLFKAAYEEKNVDLAKTKADLDKLSLKGDAQIKFQAEIERFMGTPYKFGGTDLSGVDCSGFVLKVFQNGLNIKLPHSAAAQSQLGQGVPTTNLGYGDLVFFSNHPRKITHVGIYLGQGQFVHASTSSGVIKSRLDETYYNNHYIRSRRLVTW